MTQKKNFTKDSLNELEAYFLDGGFMTKREILEKYFPSAKSFDTHYIANKAVTFWLQALKKRIWVGYGEWFGSLNEEGQFGIPQTKGQLFFALNRYRAHVMGNVVRATNLYQKGIEKHLISKPDRQELFLPIMELEDEKKHV